MGRLVWSFHSLILIAVALQLVVVTLAAPAADLISRLPGQPKVDFNQYAGYISVGESHERKLFYYFVEAQNLSATKPLVLWLNGGPGCSALGGAFSELGPFYPNASGNGLILNGDSWNQDWAKAKLTNFSIELCVALEGILTTIGPISDATNFTPSFIASQGLVLLVFIGWLSNLGSSSSQMVWKPRSKLIGTVVGCLKKLLDTQSFQDQQMKEVVKSFLGALLLLLKIVDSNKC